MGTWPVQLSILPETTGKLANWNDKGNSTVPSILTKRHNVFFLHLKINIQVPKHNPNPDAIEINPNPNLCASSNASLKVVCS